MVIGREDNRFAVRIKKKGGKKFRPFFVRIAVAVF